MSEKKEPMGMVEIAQAKIAGRTGDLYADLLAALPKCSCCNRLSVFVCKDGTYPERYACGITDDDGCMGKSDPDGWEDAPWKWHVVAARMSRPRGSDMQ